MARTAIDLITDLAEWLMREDILDEATRAEYAHRLATYAKPVPPELPFTVEEESHGR